jgi:[ribosomal protein S5]-alanine N-acetyltransferase
VRTTVLADGILLRPIEPRDAEPLADAYRRNRAHLAPWEPTRDEQFFTTRWHRDEIALLLDQFDAGRKVPLVLADGDEVVGRVNIHNVMRGVFQSASLGYWVDAAHGGRGLATSAVLAVVDLALDDLGLHRLEASTLLHNYASQRVLERAGFEVIGVAPHYLQIAGMWQEHRLYQRILHD